VVGWVLDVARKIDSDISLTRSCPILQAGGKSPNFGLNFRPQSPLTHSEFEKKQHMENLKQPPGEPTNHLRFAPRYFPHLSPNFLEERGKSAKFGFKSPLIEALSFPNGAIYRKPKINRGASVMCLRRLLILSVVRATELRENWATKLPPKLGQENVC